MKEIDRILDGEKRSLREDFFEKFFDGKLGESILSPKNN